VRHFFYFFYDTIRKKNKKRSEEMFKKGGQVSYEEKGEELVVHIGGEIDHHSAVQVRTEVDERIIATSPKRVLLELSGVDFMDSSGLGLIMGRFALIKKCGGTLALLDPSPAVMKMIKLAGMDRMVTILKTKVKGI
jgi:stage II sporulation protein AA (anti-sigma F factor antagonist)